MKSAFGCLGGGRGSVRNRVYDVVMCVWFVAGSNIDRRWPR